MSAPKISLIPLDKLHRRSDARPRADEAVAALADSIDQAGLINPIRVRQRSYADGYEVVAGSHRLQAVDALGWHEVPCIVVDEDDLHAELAMIDENLCRAELTPADRAQQTARRKAIYLELHPETAAGSAGAEARWNATDNLSTASFASETAKATGKDERTVRRDAERGEKVTGEALDLVRGTKLNTGTYLDKLKRLPAEQQVAQVKRDLAAPPEPKPQGGIAGRYQSAADSKPDPVKSAERFIALVEQIEAVPVDDLVSSGRMRAVVGQRASGLADRMAEIMERLNR